MRYRVLPYKQGSRSAKALSDALEGKVLKLEGSRFRRRQDDIIINWGSTNPSQVCSYNGDSDELRQATNKLLFFKRLDGTGLTPDYWINRDHIPDDAFPVVCRTILAGHSGEGIVIANTRDELVEARLYTKYIKKKSEFRIHIGKREGVCFIISEQQKVKRADILPEDTDFRVRNHAGGFVFQRNGIEVPDCVWGVALAAMGRFSIDFGAVDVIYNERQDRAYVLEINTAPGLEGQTVSDYASFFLGGENVH